MGATILGSPVTVTTGTVITTLPVSSPITIVSDGTYADSYWGITNGKVVPKDSSWKLGLGTVSTGVLTDNYMLLFDASSNEVKKIATSSVLSFDNITSTPTTLTGYGITDSQPLATNLTAISAIEFTTASFLKMTAAGTWSLEPKSNYLTTVLAASTYERKISDPNTTGLVLSSDTQGNRFWVAQTGGGEGGGGGGEGGGGGGAGVWGSITGTLTSQTDLNTALGLKATVAAPVFTTSFGFATAKARFVESGTDVLYKYNSVSKIKYANDGTATFVGDVVAYGTIS